MRTLSTTEQEIVRKILSYEGRNNYLGNIMDGYLVQSRVDYDHSLQSVAIRQVYRGDLSDSENNRLLIEKFEKIIDLLITVITLLRLLEKEGHIFLVQKAMNPALKGGFGQAPTNARLISSDINDPEISKLLIEYSNKQIYITEELRVLANNKFIAKDEIRFGEQIRRTRLALIVASIALCITTLGIIINVYLNLSKVDHFPEQLIIQKHGLKNDSTHFQINKQQMDTLIKIQRIKISKKHTNG